MPAVFRFSLQVKCLLACLLLFSLNAVGQTSIEDVHVTSRDVTEPSSASKGSSAKGSMEEIGGSYLQVIRKAVNLVLVPVSVTDSMERLVTGLTPENFQIFENKKRQQIRNFSSEDVPVSIGLIVDTSGSMKDKMDRVREAVRQFCDTANLQDEFFMITFSDEPRMVQDFTTNPSNIETPMATAIAQGRTSLLDAIYMGIHKMRDARYSRKALLIISDGGDNHSRYSEREIKAAVMESDVMVYSIGVFDQYMPTQEEQLGPELLSEITEPTGGRTFTLNDPADLPSVATYIGRALRTEYVIGYTPETAPKDGKWHKIQVKLRLPHELSFLHVHAKKGYYAMANGGGTSGSGN